MPYGKASAPRRVPQPIQQRRLAGPVRTAHRYDAELGVNRRDHVRGLGHEPQLPLAFVVDHFDERQRCVRKIWGCFQVWLHIGCIDGGGVEIGHCSQSRARVWLGQHGLAKGDYIAATFRASSPQAVWGQLYTQKSGVSASVLHVASSLFRRLIWSLG